LVIQVLVTFKLKAEPGSTLVADLYWHSVFKNKNKKIFDGKIHILKATYN
jgi:hypothetical protein